MSPCENEGIHEPQNSFTFLASPACPPMVGIRIVHDHFNCNGFFDKALQFAEEHQFTRIMLVSNWPAYFGPTNGTICFLSDDGCRLEREPSFFYMLLDAAFDALRARLLEFRNRGVEIVIVGATPSGHWNVPAELVRRKFLGVDTQNIEFIDRDEYETSFAPMKSRLISLASSIGAEFVNPLEFLCDNHRCPTVDKDGESLFVDEGHFRSAAVRTSRFQFLDDAAGVNNRVSAVPKSQNRNP
jgi:SGNH domain (fused to AT3 domains)